MTPRGFIPPLLLAVQEMLPETEIVLQHRQDWYSMTFAGERIEFSIALVGQDSAGRLKALAERLAEEEFCLPKMLVADIAFRGVNESGDGAIMFAEALLLNGD